jgi:ESF2/ABP1 family protein
MKALTPEELEAFQAKLERTGVVYISRVPPYMKPLKIKHLLSPIGEIGRIYLQAEDSRIREKRKRLSGNSRKNFTEGWVEFMDKNKAKKAVLLLNNSIIGKPFYWFLFMRFLICSIVFFFGGYDSSRRREKGQFLS